MHLRRHAQIAYPSDRQHLLPVGPGMASAQPYALSAIALVLLRFALDFGYIQYASVRYADFYMPIVFRFDAYQYAVSLLFYAISLAFVKPTVHSVSNIIQWMFVIFVFAPLTPNHHIYFSSYKMLLEIYHVLCIRFQLIYPCLDCSIYL